VVDHPIIRTDSGTGSKGLIRLVQTLRVRRRTTTPFLCGNSRPFEVPKVILVVVDLQTPPFRVEILFVVIKDLAHPIS
jgi:hypothetical protein